jgi:hypothetical protein
MDLLLQRTRKLLLYLPYLQTLKWYCTHLIRVDFLYGIQIMSHNPSTIDNVLNMTQPLLCKQSLNAFAIEILTLAINISSIGYF